MNAIPSKERQKQKDKERQDRSRKMKRNGFVFIKTWVQKETLADLKQLFGDEDVGDAIDKLLTVIRRSEMNRVGIKAYRQEVEIVMRDKITRKRVLQCPMDTVMNRMMKE